MTRIATLQRQARELGRLRTGLTDFSGAKPRPVRSGTWVLTSHAEHYVRAAADLFGGRPEQWQPLGNGAQQWRVVTEASSLDAILPPGDPLSQAYELWSGGGCDRRCDGDTESLTDSPCLCRGKFGDSWFEQGKKVVCSATSRLNVILPDMPDFGVFRLETHSFHAANEIAATVDMIRSATGGATMVPVALRIEQRTRVANGQTKQFPVVAVELRGHTTAQLLTGQVQAAIAVSPQHSAPALGAEVGRDDATTLELLLSATTDAELTELWRASSKSDRVAKAGREARARITGQPLGSPPSSGTGTVEPSGDPDELWQQILKRVPPEWSSTEVEQNFAAITKVDAGNATVADMRRYLGALDKAAA